MRGPSFFSPDALLTPPRPHRRSSRPWSRGYRRLDTLTTRPSQIESSFSLDPSNWRSRLPTLFDVGTLAWYVLVSVTV